MRGLWDKGRDLHFPGFNVRERERERERKRKKESKLLSSILEVPSIGIHQAKSESLSTRRGLRVCNKKRRISPKIQRRRFREINDFGLRRLPTHAITLQEVGVLPTLDYFYFKGCLALVSALRGCLAEY